MGLLSKLFGKPKQPTPQPQVNVKSETGKSHSKKMKVAGVTFGNRQECLKRLRADKQAGKVVNVSMQEYSYQGEPAIKIIANGMEIGNLHTEDCDFVKNNQSRILGIKDLYIGYAEDIKTYYAKITLIIQNKT